MTASGRHCTLVFAFMEGAASQCAPSLCMSAGSATCARHASLVPRPGVHAPCTMPHHAPCCTMHHAAGLRRSEASQRCYAPCTPWASLGHCRGLRLVPPCCAVKAIPAARRQQRGGSSEVGGKRALLASPAPLPTTSLTRLGPPSYAADSQARAPAALRFAWSSGQCPCERDAAAIGPPTPHGTGRSAQCIHAAVAACTYAR